MSLRVAILISGTGSNMVALVRSMTGDHPARPVLVISSRADADGLDRAKEFGVPTATVDRTTYASRAAFETELGAALDKAQPDLVCLAGFMHILSAAFLAARAGQVLNIHPSLLPRHRGLDTHARVLAAGDRESGCTVHEVTPALDDGPILGQTRVPVKPGDTPEALAARVLEAEHRLYTAVLRRVAEGDRTPLHLP